MQGKGATFKKFIDYYDGKCPIYYRKPLSPLKQDSQVNIHSDFFNDIVNLKTGYFGSGINTILTAPEENKQAWYDSFLKRNNMPAKNAETTKMTSTCGLSSRLLYVHNGEIYIRNLPATDVIYEYEHDILNPSKAIVYYSTQDLLGQTHWYCDVYDQQMVYFFEKLPSADANKSGVYTPRANIEGKTEAPHLFNEIPVIAFQNNAELKSNCYMTLDMMDAYDEVMSDAASEIKASRNAYLKIFGDLYTGVDSDGQPINLTDALREMNALVFGQSDDGTRHGDAEFLQKTLDHQAISAMLTLLRTQIYEQSNSIDIRDLMSNANQRVFTTKIAMMRFEADAQQTETFFNAALNKQNRLLAQYAANADNIDLKEEDFRNIFTRVFPQDLQAVASTFTSLLAASLPVKTALELSEIVSSDKVDEIAMQIEEQGSALPVEVEE